MRVDVMDAIIIYVAGFVGSHGGQIKYHTDNVADAIEWTKYHSMPNHLSVCRGFTQQDLDWGPDYMNSVMNNDVLGYDGYPHIRKVS